MTAVDANEEEKQDPSKKDPSPLIPHKFDFESPLTGNSSSKLNTLNVAMIRTILKSPAIRETMEKVHGKDTVDRQVEEFMAREVETITEGVEKKREKKAASKKSEKEEIKEGPKVRFATPAKFDAEEDNIVGSIKEISSNKSNKVQSAVKEALMVNLPSSE